MLCHAEDTINTIPHTKASHDKKDNNSLTACMLLSSFLNHQLSFVVLPIQRTKEKNDPKKRFQNLI